MIMIVWYLLLPRFENKNKVVGNAVLFCFHDDLLSFSYLC